MSVTSITSKRTLTSLPARIKKSRAMLTYLSRFWRSTASAGVPNCVLSRVFTSQKTTVSLSSATMSASPYAVR